MSVPDTTYVSIEQAFERLDQDLAHLLEDHYQRLGSELYHLMTQHDAFEDRLTIADLRNRVEVSRIIGKLDDLHQCQHLLAQFYGPVGEF